MSTNIVPQNAVLHTTKKPISYSTDEKPARCIAVQECLPGDTPGVIAVCAIKVGGVILRRVTVTNKGRGTFVNFPSRFIAGAWVDLVEITSPALRQAVVDAVLAAVREMGGAQ